MKLASISMQASNEDCIIKKCQMYLYVAELCIKYNIYFHKQIDKRGWMFLGLIVE